MMIINPAASYALTKRIEHGMDVRPCVGDRYVTPLNNSYTELHGAAPRESVLECAYRHFLSYASDKVGALRWRVPPEVSENGEYYMRLAIE